MPASPEFITICRSQVAIIASLGASLSVVYLTEKLVKDRNEKPKLIPIVSYPESREDWEVGQVMPALLSNIDVFNNVPPLLQLPSAASTPISFIPPTAETPEPENSPRQNASEWPDAEQIVLPLIHQGVILGFLVTGREDRPWSPLERTQIQDIVETLAIARILDQRSQWLERQFRVQQQIQAQQSDTFHTLLHQFKNPLTALRTLGKLLMKRLLPDDKNWGVANSIVRESDRLWELLNQFSATLELGESDFDFAGGNSDFRIEPMELRESQKTPMPAPGVPLLPGAVLTQQPLSVGEILTPLLTSTQAIADERQLTLVIEPWENLPLVEAHPQALREVLSNLLDNALKYTPANQLITVMIRCVGKRLGIGISDTGGGVPSADLEHLFERHYRGVQAEGEIPGTGLGLAIARDLIRQMQGEIEVFSPLQPEWVPGSVSDFPRDRGRGTTFIVWLGMRVPGAGGGV